MRRTPFIFACCIVLMSPAFAATTLTLDYPRGGEVFVVGTTQQVKLSGRYKTGSSVAVELSRDGGGTFTALGTITVARNVTPTLQFPVTEPVSSNCIVKVSIPATSGAAAQSTSQASAPFAIVLSLNGGGAPAPAALADGSVTNPKIAPAAVTTDKISSTPASSGFVLTADGNGNADWSPLPPAGTVTNVLGSGAVTVSNGTSTPLISVADATTSSKGIVQIGNGLTVTNGVVSNSDAGSVQNIFKNIADQTGTTKFSATSNNDSLQVQGTGAASVTFDAVNKRIVINATDTNSGGTVTSVSGSGAVGITNGTTTPAISITESALSLNNIGGTLNAAKGGTGSTSLSGLVVGNGAGAMTALKTNLTAIIGPTVNDDNTAGYVIGSRWFDTVAKNEYVLTDASTGAAVWTATTSGVPSGYMIIGSTPTAPVGYTYTGNSVANQTSVEWSAKASMPTARYGLAVATVANVIYAIGGTNGTYLATNEAYDPSTNSWTTKTAMPTARGFFAAAMVGNVIYAIGGSNVGTNGPYLATNEAYDPSIDSWIAKTAMPTARCGLAGAIVGNAIYAIGGNDGTNNLATNEAYDPSTDSWTTKSAMPTAREFLAATAVGNVIYTIGGNNSPFLQTNEAYDTSTDSWTTKAAMPTPRFYLAAATVGNVIYAVGGYNGVYLATYEAYDPSTDSWTTKSAMPTARGLLAAGMVGNVIYNIGGTNGPYLATNEAYDTTVIFFPTSYIHRKN